MKIGFMGIGWRCRLDPIVDPHSVELLAFADYLYGQYKALGPVIISEVLMASNLTNMSSWPHKRIYDANKHSSNWLNQFDKLVIPSQYSIHHQTEKYGYILPSTVETLELLQHYHGEIIFLMQDPRPKFTQYIRDWYAENQGPKARVKYVAHFGTKEAYLANILPYAQRPIGKDILRHQFRRTIGPWAQGQTDMSAKCYPLLFAGHQFDPWRMQIINKYAPEALGVGRTEPELKSITQNKMVSGAKVLEYMKLSIGSLIVLTPEHMSFGAWATPRFCQAFLYGSMPLLPSEYAEAFQGIIPPALLSEIVVHDASEAWNRLAKFNRMEDFRNQILSWCWDWMCKLQGWAL